MHLLANSAFLQPRTGLDKLARHEDKAENRFCWFTIQIKCRTIRGSVVYNHSIASLIWMNSFELGFGNLRNWRKRKRPGERAEGLKIWMIGIVKCLAPTWKRRSGSWTKMLVPVNATADAYGMLFLSISLCAIRKVVEAFGEAHLELCGVLHLRLNPAVYPVRWHTVVIL